MKKILTAVGGSAADPPHNGHLAVLKMIRRAGFDRIVWIISGNRPGKEEFKCCPNDRITMTELLVPRKWRKDGNPQLEIIYDDIYGQNTATHTWLAEILPQRYPNSEFCWFTGSDSVVPQAKFHGQSEIQARWYLGQKLWNDYNFLVIERESYDLSGCVLPGNFRILSGSVLDIASSKIRRLIFAQEPFEHLMPKAVANYIKRHDLYGYQPEEMY